MQPSQALLRGMHLTFHYAERMCLDSEYRLGNNLSGHYKRGVGMAMHIGIGNFGGAIASNIYRSQDAPRYILGRASPIY